MNFLYYKLLKPHSIIEIKTNKNNLIIKKHYIYDKKREYTYNLKNNTTHLAYIDDFDLLIIGAPSTFIGMTKNIYIIDLILKKIYEINSKNLQFLINKNNWLLENNQLYCYSNNFNKLIYFNYKRKYIVFLNQFKNEYIFLNEILNKKINLKEIFIKNKINKNKSIRDILINNNLIYILLDNLKLYLFDINNFNLINKSFIKHIISYKEKNRLEKLKNLFEYSINNKNTLIKEYFN